MIQKIVIGIAVLIVLFVVKSRCDRKKHEEKLRGLFAQEWGMSTREEYSDSIRKHIRYYHEQNRTENSIDSITWNDLEMELIFQQMNHTRTSAGEEILYHLLRTPEFSEKKLLEREQVLQGYQRHPDKRTELELALYRIGKTDRISVYEFLSQTKKLKQMKRWPHIVAALFLSAAILALFFSNALSLLFLCVVMGVNVYFYYSEKAKMIQNVALFSFILGMIQECEKLAKLSFEECEGYFERLRELSGRFHKFRRFHFLVSGGSTMSGSLFDSLFDYVRILFHFDLIKLATMIREVKKYEEELLEIYHIIGFLDSMLAVASYREAAMAYTLPVFHEPDSHKAVQTMQIQGVYHPLVKHPVTNDVTTKRCMLLTGSNASGKSTFLKAAAINALFAQTIHTVLADTYEACFFRIYSSMALRDDILSKESYFIVEIKSLKRIFSALQTASEIPVLCFVDEILRGTNTVERVAASSVLLDALSKEKAMCFAATHDVELTYLLEEQFENYHFEEQLSEGDISFDYRLRKGRADSRNAIRLLSMIGFEKELVSKAQGRVEAFLGKGIWE